MEKVGFRKVSEIIFGGISFCHFNSITRHALRWNLQGKRKRGRPRNTWRRDTEKEMNALGYKWRDLEELAKHRGRWRAFVNGPCSAIWSHGRN